MIVLLLMLLACGPECGPRGGTCPDDERCLWVGHYECLSPCSYDEDCPTRQACTGEAPSCPVCQDLNGYCE